MKAKIDGVEVECTPQEFLYLIQNRTHPDDVCEEVSQ